MVTNTTNRIPQDTLRHEARAVADLLRELKDETTTLIQQEVALAKVEVRRKVMMVIKSAVYMAAGAVVAYVALLSVVAAAILGLVVILQLIGVAVGVSVWLAPLIIAVIAGIVGYGLIQKAISTIKRETLLPERTLKTLEEDKRWLEQKVA